MATEDFCIKIIHKAADFLDLWKEERLLNDDDRTAVMEFICELAEKLSFCKMLNVSAYKISEKCALLARKKDFSKRVFCGRMFQLFPQLLSGMNCGRKELKKSLHNFRITNSQRSC